MNEIVYLIFRRMRRPLLALLLSYAIAMLGMTLIPTVDENGEFTYLTIFQAFYWISYTATTIGYGELPYHFSEWQRMWVALSIYYTVPVWVYAGGKIVGLLSDPLFRAALAENSFARRTKSIRDPFVVICGFGEAGYRLTLLLREANYQCVVIDKDADRVNHMMLDPQLYDVLSLTGDAANVELLERSGVRSAYCRAVLAITDDEEVNIKVALAAKLLSANQNDCQVICRTMSRYGGANARSFDTEVVVNANQLFAERLTMALRRPSIAALIDCLQAEMGAPYEGMPRPPVGKWIICGYSDIGKTLGRFLEYEGVDTVIVDERADLNLQGQVIGVGTEEVTLREAHIEKAQAIIASREYDPDNLSIALTAKSVKPSLFVVGRQNRSANRNLFKAAGFDYVMEEAELIVGQIYPTIAKPLLNQFLDRVRHQNEAWGKALFNKVLKLSPDIAPYQYVLNIDEEHAPAVVNHLKSGHLLRMQSLWTRPDDTNSFNDALPLLLLRESGEVLLPNAAVNLQEGDKILLIYHDKSLADRLNRVCRDEGELYWAIHGKDMTRSKILNYFFSRFG